MKRDVLSCGHFKDLAVVPYNFSTLDESPPLSLSNSDSTSDLRYMTKWTNMATQSGTYNLKKDILNDCC